MKPKSIGDVHGTSDILGAGALNMQAESTMRALEVRQAMGEHNNAIENLGNLLCRLQERLMFVSSHGVDEVEGAGKGLAVYRAPLAAEIESSTHQLRYCIQSVEDMLLRLEV